MKFNMKFICIFSIGVGANALASIHPRQNTSASAPVVDLGYSTYEGYYNSTSQLNIFKGYALV